MKISEESLNRLFDDFNKLKILIIGDVMIDAYYWGKVDRISPEAPVPIVAVERKEARMGGAANVALNIQAMGATPILCSVIGMDEEGEEFIDLVKQNNQTTQGLLSVAGRQTTKKTRIIGNKHQMLRIDAEDSTPINSKEEKDFVGLIQQIMEEEKIDAVIFEDYDKGCITKKVIQQIVLFCAQKNIPTTVDPKKKNFKEYKNVTLFKPNLKELKEGLKIDFDHKKPEELTKAIQQLETILGNQRTLITLSERGVFLNTTEERYHVPAHLRNITDVSGAGDTVISIATLCLALNTSNELLAELSNLAGGLVCENIGVVPIERKDLLKEAKRLFIKK